MEIEEVTRDLLIEEIEASREVGETITITKDITTLMITRTKLSKRKPLISNISNNTHKRIIMDLMTTLLITRGLTFLRKRNKSGEGKT